MSRKNRIMGIDFGKAGTTVLPYAVGGVALYFGLPWLIKKVNPFTPNASTQQALDEAATSGSPWNVHYVDGHPGAHLITAASGKMLSDAIYHSAGFFFNDYDTPVAAIKKLSYKSQVSSLVYWFQHYYGKDLFNYFAGGSNLWDPVKNQQMIDSIVTYVNSLPSGL